MPLADAMTRHLAKSNAMLCMSNNRGIGNLPVDDNPGVAGNGDAPGTCGRYGSSVVVLSSVVAAVVVR
jgi:hypothetical protein